MIPEGREVWFRRLLIGVLVDLLAERSVPIRGVTVWFSPDSEFRYPHLDNELRFVGVAQVEVGEAGLPADLDAALLAAWAELVDQIDVLPLGDRLQPAASTLAVVERPGGFTLDFDLRAD